MARSQVPPQSLSHSHVCARALSESEHTCTHARTRASARASGTRSPTWRHDRPLEARRLGRERDSGGAEQSRSKLPCAGMGAPRLQHGFVGHVRRLLHTTLSTPYRTLYFIAHSLRATPAPGRALAPTTQSLYRLVLARSAWPPPSLAPRQLSISHASCAFTLWGWNPQGPAPPSLWCGISDLRISALMASTMPVQASSTRRSRLRARLLAKSTASRPRRLR